MSGRTKKLGRLILFLLPLTCAIAQETIPLIPDPLLAVVMGENSHKFVILLFHRNGPKSEAMGVLVSNAIMRDPTLARRALFASAEVSDSDNAMLARDLNVTSFPSLIVATVHKDGPKSADIKVYSKVKVNVDANTLHLALMLGLCSNSEAQKQPYFDAEMRNACDSLRKGVPPLSEQKPPETSPSFNFPPRARFSKRPVNPMSAALEGALGFPLNNKAGGGLLSSTPGSAQSAPPPPPPDLNLPRPAIDPETPHLSGVWKGKAFVYICGKQTGGADITLTLKDGDSDPQNALGRVSGALAVNGASQESVIALYGHTRLETDNIAIATRVLRGGPEGEKYSPYSLRLTAEDPYWYVGYYQTLSGILHRGNAGCPLWLDRGETLGVILRKQ